ncbi:iron-sulfur cluster biosynthesis family protein [Neobacillus mesonae]|nr:iron-sulfur cluster biosynthesis family protein [Neobacillus mesonae]
MKINLSHKAAELLTKNLGSRPGFIRLMYDSEGCGCAVSGVPAFRIVDEQEDSDMVIESNVPELTFILDSQKAVFFEEELNLSTDPGDLSLRLSSSGQHYGLYLFPRDDRAASA